MLKKAYDAFIGGPTQPVEGRGADWRDAAPNAERTGRPENAPRVVERFPNSIQAVLKSVERAEHAVLNAETERIRAEVTYKALMTEWETKIDGLILTEQRALAELSCAQKRLGCELRDLGAFNRMDGKMTIHEFLQHATPDDEDRVPTVRLEP